MSFRNKPASSRVLLPFGLDYSDVLTQGQLNEGPSVQLPVHGAISRYEEASAQQALNLAQRLYDGQFYTGQAPDETKGASAPPIERYLDRYVKVKKVGCSIDEYPYQLEFFPEELYLVMGISKSKKKLLLSTYKSEAAVLLQDQEDSAQTMLEKLKSLAEDLDADPNQHQDDEAPEEEFDEEFDEEDDDDYNAEKYFDDGDDDMPDDNDDEAAF